MVIVFSVNLIRMEKITITGVILNQFNPLNYIVNGKKIWLLL
jgi:hypothetical protein